MKAPHPPTSREVAERIGLDYRKNFNKREGRLARKLAGFVQRTGRPLRWFLFDESLRGQRPVEIWRRFKTAQS